MSELKRPKSDRPSSRDELNVNYQRFNKRRRISLTSSQFNRKSSSTSQGCDKRSQNDEPSTSSESDPEPKVKSVVVKVKKQWTFILSRSDNRNSIVKFLIIHSKQFWKKHFLLVVVSMRTHKFMLNSIAINNGQTKAVCNVYWHHFMSHAICPHVEIFISNLSSNSSRKIDSLCANDWASERSKFSFRFLIEILLQIRFDTNLKRIIVQIRLLLWSEKWRETVFASRCDSYKTFVIKFQLC